MLPSSTSSTVSRGPKILLGSKVLFSSVFLSFCCAGFAAVSAQESQLFSGLPAETREK